MVTELLLLYISAGFIMLLAWVISQRGVLMAIPKRRCPCPTNAAVLEVNFLQRQINHAGYMSASKLLKRKSLLRICFWCCDVCVFWSHRFHFYNISIYLF